MVHCRAPDCKVYLASFSLNRLKKSTGVIKHIKIHINDILLWRTCTGSSGRCTGFSLCQVALDLWDGWKHEPVNLSQVYKIKSAFTKDCEEMSFPKEFTKFKRGTFIIGFATSPFLKFIPP